MNKIKAYFATAEGGLKTTLHAVVGGAAIALIDRFKDPSAFNFSTPAGLHDIYTAAGGGALIALFHIFIPSPSAAAAQSAPPATPSTPVKTS